MSSAALTIIDYRPEFQPVFADLNYAWIRQHFTVEEEDRQALDQPQKKILGPGGAILLAQLDKEIIGTVALIPMPEHTLELAKMTVDSSFRGHGIGYRLGEAAIERAKKMGAKRIYLESNTALPAALKLYHKLGFVEIKDHPSPYARCNIQMEMQL